MTETHDETNEPKTDLGLERTQMAAVRTDLALMRTGFAIASFGAGVTQLVGRDSWPSWHVDLLTIVFVLTGMTLVQVGIARTRIVRKELGSRVKQDPFSAIVMKIAPWMLQIALLAFIALILVH
jgi:uncharacterized membrane protein YidH (DUF202 family)